MQDRFLFDDGDPKQRGAGCDRLGTKKDGLALRWIWGRVCDRSWPRGSKELKDTRRTPGQSCYASLGKGWELSAIFWHTDYEAVVRHYDNRITSWNKSVGDDYVGEVLVTRLAAQLKAEQLLIDVWKELDELLKKKGVIVTKIVSRLKGKRKIA